jgi:hypothetical protein
LHERSDGKGLAGCLHDPRSGAGAALELMADHASSATDITLRYRSSRRGVKSGDRVLSHHQEGRRIAEPAVIGFSHDRQ